MEPTAPCPAVSGPGWFDPKVVARVLRFEHAVALLPTRPLADVAAARGYAHQAHLNREFRDLAGCTPRMLALTFVQTTPPGRAEARA
ncbi:MAG: helix-turn-helix domain-containing protein [Mycobacteriales bacterium]